MKASFYYFSGTGNSLYISKKLKEEMEQEAGKNNQGLEGESLEISIVPIQKVIKHKSIEDQSDMVGIIYPTYFLDTPNVVKEFAKKLRLNENCYLFLYANYGETLGNALYNLNQIFTKQRLLANYEVVLPDNSIIFETKKSAIPKMLESAEKTIKEHAKEIYARVITEKSSYHFGYHMVTKVMKPLARVGMGFYNMKVNPATCNGCGMCEKICPMNNIHMEAKKTNVKSPIFENHCESCFACMHMCPKEAIRYASMSKKKTDYQYRHPEVSIKEMMESNVY